MYKIYFKQAVEMLKQNKFFSFVSIIGTALAVMMIMVIIVTDSIKNTNVAPENKRDKTMYLTRLSVKDTINNYSGETSLSYKVVRHFSLLKTPTLVSIIRLGFSTIHSDISTEPSPAKVRYPDPSFWKILSFTFLEGKPFSEETFEAGVCEAVITQSTAKKLFNGDNAMGQTFYIDDKSYRVIGIVKDVSPVFTSANADVWAPYTSTENLNDGSYVAMMLVNHKRDVAAIQQELRNIEKKYLESEPNHQIHIRDPHTHRVEIMNIRDGNETQIGDSVKKVMRRTWFLLLVILLVPAINLSALNLSRIKERTQEIGVRKAFGAKKHTILVQVLWENLIASFLGGFIGLIASFFIVIQLKNWLLEIPDDSVIPISTFISIPVMVSVFIVCVLINVLSATIPAYKAANMTIIHSLTDNEEQAS